MSLEMVQIPKSASGKDIHNITKIRNTNDKANVTEFLPSNVTNHEADIF